MSRHNGDLGAKSWVLVMWSVAQVSRDILQLFIIAIFAILTGVTLAASGVGAAELSNSTDLVQVGASLVIR